MFFIKKSPFWLYGVSNSWYLECLQDQTVFYVQNLVANIKFLYCLTGSHWVTTTVEAILGYKELDNIELLIYSLEDELGYEAFLTSKRPRLTFSNLRYHQLPRGVCEGRAKVIHISRNPLDVAVSLYRFSQIFTGYGCYSGSWDTFFDSFIAGRVPKGSWHDHMMDWIQYKDKKHILFVRYEDFIRYPQKMIRHIAKFIQKPLDDDMVNKIAEKVSFKSMKSDPKLNIKHEFLKGDLIRKGIIGDWVNYFTEEQKEKMDQICKKMYSTTGVEFSLK